MSRAVAAALMLAAGGCATSNDNPEPGPSAPSGGGEDPVGSEIANLGAAITGCSASASSTTLDLSLVATPGPAVISAPNGKLMVNGNPCTNAAGAALTTTVVTKINVTGSSADDKIILDFLPGTFGAKILSNTGGITIDFNTTKGTADVDTVMLRGSAAAESFKFATSTDATADIFIDVTGDKTADIKITPAFPAIPVTLVASMGAGADTVIGNPLPTDMTTFAGVSGALPIGSLRTTLTAYGGAGADKFTGGDGDDAFYGGADDDLFKMAAIDDGSDIYSGDTGNDTVDYSNRTVAVAVDLGPSAATLVGTVDLGATPALFGASGTINAKTLTLTVDGTDLGVVTFATPTVGPAHVVSQINAACTTKCVAYLTGSNFLNITTTATVTPSSMQVKTGSTSAALLGLSATPLKVMDIPTVVGTGDLSVAGTITSLDTETLQITVDGTDLATPVTFAAPANAAAVVTQVNARCLTRCLASLTSAKFLTIATKATGVKPSIQIKAVGTTAQTDLGLDPTLLVNPSTDPDDGIISPAENDDVRASTENITGGSGNDILVGGPTKNLIKGGGGDDTIEGGVNGLLASNTAPACTGLTSSDGDLLQGEAGNDTFYLPFLNCYNVVAGGAGTDIVNLSGRSAENAISNDAASNDGDVTASEKANVGNDIETLIGGYGVDTITGGMNDDRMDGGRGDDFLIGGAGDDTFVAGVGADTFNGGMGFDTVDYSAYSVAMKATLCVTNATSIATIDTACGARDDGAILVTESDQIANVEHVLGGTGDDVMTAAATATDTTFEGGMGIDTLTGGGGNDNLWGDAGNDILSGGAGDDNLDGGGGTDSSDGGADGDVCVTDTTTPDSPRVNCELG